MFDKFIEYFIIIYGKVQWTIYNNKVYLKIFLLVGIFKKFGLLMRSRVLEFKIQFLNIIKKYFQGIFVLSKTIQQ